MHEFELFASCIYHGSTPLLPLTRLVAIQKHTLLGNDGNAIFTIMAEGQRLSMTSPWRAAAALYSRQVSVARANE